MTDQEKVIKDALETGVGFMQDGKHIDPKEIYKSEEEMKNKYKHIAWFLGGFIIGTALVIGLFILLINAITII